MRTVVLALAAAVLLSGSGSALAASTSALQRGQDGFFHTGDGVRVKKVAFIKVKVYAIDHYMKDLPAQRSKQAVIDANVDKRFVWKMLRDVDVAKIKAALREAYATNGFEDASKIDRFVDAFKRDFKEGDAVTISYDAAKNSTTVSSPGGTATIAGDDFMRATWRIWLGKIDQPGLGESLIEKL